jgi:hypothetical protein
VTAKPLPAADPGSEGFWAAAASHVLAIQRRADYPHSDTTWPHSIKLAHERLQGLTEDVQYKILRGNAERLYRFTPAPPPAKAG